MNLQEAKEYLMGKYLTEDGGIDARPGYAERVIPSLGITEHEYNEIALAAWKRGFDDAAHYFQTDAIKNSIFSSLAKIWDEEDSDYWNSFKHIP